jgi:hypothetical protein
MLVRYMPIHADFFDAVHIKMKFYIQKVSISAHQRMAKIVFAQNIG